MTSTGMMRSVDRALSEGAPLMGSITPEGARKLENHCVSGEGCGRSEQLPSRWRRTRLRAASSVERRAGTKEARWTHVVRLAEGVAEEGVVGEGEGHGGERGVGSSRRVHAFCAESSGSSRRGARQERVVVSCHLSWFARPNDARFSDASGTRRSEPFAPGLRWTNALEAS